MLMRTIYTFVVIIFFYVSVYANEREKEDSLVRQDNLVIQINYCTQCGYKAVATALQGELRKEFGVESELVIGPRGSFNVTVNGELIFSKAEAGRFPKPGEIVTRIKEHLQN